MVGACYGASDLRELLVSKAGAESGRRANEVVERAAEIDVF
ncbi:MAG TPA: hypothetical protein VK361_01545 [Rubrobacteraceae bacterium]|jgi:hypothetical protein|nr:hypothetical protein [Rubrobacteraceae bacterium]